MLMSPPAFWASTAMASIRSTVCLPPSMMTTSPGWMASEVAVTCCASFVRRSAGIAAAPSSGETEADILGVGLGMVSEMLAVSFVGDGLGPQAWRTRSQAPAASAVWVRI
jgi:hypothetical protein